MLPQISFHAFGLAAATARARARRPYALAITVLLGLAGATIPTAAQSPGPDADEINRRNAIIVATLVRTTLVALHQANTTGNYTVLRDLAAPSFRDRNSAADLGRVFTDLRESRIDLAATAVFDPELTVAPGLDENGMLRIAGILPTLPEAVAFELIFENVNGAWRLFGISLARITNDVAATPSPDEGALAAREASAPAPASLTPPAPRAKPADQ